MIALPLASLQVMLARAHADENRSPLAGLHVLIVEGETAIAMMLSETLAELGATSAIAARLADAMSVIAAARFDIAILDIDIAGQSSWPIAGALDLRGVPFIVTTGYERCERLQVHRDRPRLLKPYLPDQIEAALLGAIKAAAGATGSTERGEMSRGGDDVVDEAMNELRAPAWSQAVESDAWQRHVPDHVRAIWQDFSDSQRIALAMWADSLVDSRTCDADRNH